MHHVYQPQQSFQLTVYNAISKDHGRHMLIDENGNERNCIHCMHIDTYSMCSSANSTNFESVIVQIMIMRVEPNGIAIYYNYFAS